VTGKTLQAKARPPRLGVRGARSLDYRPLAPKRGVTRANALNFLGATEKPQRKLPASSRPSNSSGSPGIPTRARPGREYCRCGTKRPLPNPIGSRWRYPQRALPAHSEPHGTHRAPAYSGNSVAAPSSEPLKRTGQFLRDLGTLLVCESTRRFGPGSKAPPVAEI